MFVALAGMGFGQTLPDHWTGDSGIDTYKETTTVHGGAASCKIDVNTGSQSSCDMRNDEIAVTAGDTYTYTFWGITSAHVKIRVVLEWTGASITYGDYLAQGNTTWTEHTYTGTVPSGATGVKLGIRCYDVSGFSAPETQYVDDFSFESPTGTPVTVQNGDMESWPTTGPDNPTSFLATTVSTSEIDLSWTRNSNLDSVMVVWSPDASFGTPSDGSIYAVGDTIPGGDSVIFRGVDTTYAHTNLNSGTAYYYKAFSVDGSTNYSTGVTDNATTNYNPTSTTLPYSQTFDSDLGDCHPYSVSGDTKEWNWNSSDQAAQMNGYNSGDVEEDWLIIPGIDFDSYSNEIMTFDSWYKYGSDDADNYLKLLYSSDYPGFGDPSSYTWNELTFTHPSSAETWTSSGDIDLSTISGSSVYIAFKYHYNSGKYRRWEIDNISIQESTTNPEPSNYPTDFAATANSATAITNTWTDATGSQLPSGYLILIKDNTGSFTTPVDGTPVSDDTDLSDGNGAINVDYGDESYQWTGLSIATQYDFVIYSYTNSGANIDYKTDGTAPTASATTNTANTDLIISEVADPKDHYEGRFVELYNLSSDTIFFNNETWYLVRQSAGGGYGSVQLTDTINPGEAYTIGYSDANFSGQYGFNPDLHSGYISGNGDDGYFLYYGGDETSGTLIDAYGVIDEDGTGKPWEYTDGKAVRKRSVGSPNSTWTASEWVITRPADVVNMTPGQHFNYVTWQGTTDTDWDTKANWDNGFIPDISMDVTIPSATNSPVIGTGSYAYCWNLTVDAAGSLTIASDATGQGGLYVGGTSTGNVKVNCYTTTGKWHGMAASVSGQTANALYLNGNPDVWMKYWNEGDTLYHYITSLSEPLDDMKGWMVWVDSTGLTDTTFTFEGALRSGTVSPTESIVRSQAGSAFGYNFVGNPFTSTIDWDDTVGWTKTNLDTAIYTYNDGNWASYINGSGTNGGSRYIAMNQGFFVQVSDNGSSTGTLTATNDVQVNQTANFMKSRSAAGDYSLVRLEIDAENMSDETVVKLMDNATNGYDGQYDAHKIFSFNSDHPQIFSTANGNMSINTLPVETGAVGLDVTGKAGDMMTINATERTNLEEVWLVDELTGVQTDLTKEGYSFIYNPSVTNRFTLHFSIVNVNEQTETGNLFTIYAANRKANVIIPSGTRANIEIYNMLGQKVASASNRSGLNQFTLRGNQYYIVKVYNNNQVETKKIVIRKQYIFGTKLAQVIIRTKINTKLTQEK